MRRGTCLMPRTSVKGAGHSVLYKCFSMNGRTKKDARGGRMADPDINREDLMEYFAELDPDKRQRMLDAIEDSDIDNSITDFCRTMYQRRYTDPKDPGHKVDNWLWIKPSTGLANAYIISEIGPKDKSYPQALPLHAQQRDKNKVLCQERRAATRNALRCIKRCISMPNRN